MIDETQNPIDFKTPESLFHTPDKKLLSQVYRELAKIWHPDTPTGNTESFQHLNKLYDLGLNKIEKGYWGFNGYCEQTTWGYQVKRPFELGDYYIGEYHMWWIVAGKYAKQFSHSYTDLSFKYADEAMKDKFINLLPYDCFRMDADVTAIGKQDGLICLRDLHNYYNQSIPIKHVAWIISGLHHMACFLQYNNIVHCDISLDSVFINPATHEVGLLGGWFWSASAGESIKTVPTRTEKILPWLARTNKRAYHSIDGELIRLTAREMMTDLVMCEPLLGWANSIASDDAVENYRTWDKALDAALGKRQFTEMSITTKEIYSAM